MPFIQVYPNLHHSPFSDNTSYGLQLPWHTTITFDNNNFLLSVGRKYQACGRKPIRSADIQERDSDESRSVSQSAELLGIVSSMQEAPFFRCQWYPGQRPGHSSAKMEGVTSLLRQVTSGFSIP